MRVAGGLVIPHIFFDALGRIERMEKNKELKWIEQNK